MLSKLPGHSLPPGPIMIPDKTLFGALESPHEEDCPAHGAPLLVIHHETDGIATRIALPTPDSVAAHIATLWALATKIYGEVGFRAALERAAHEINHEIGETRIRL